MCGGVCAISGLAGMAGAAAAGASVVVGDKGGVCSTSSSSSGLLARSCSGKIAASASMVGVKGSIWLRRGS